jgi:transcriptional regulator GlxA family with amidase domain
MAGGLRCNSEVATLGADAPRHRSHSGKETDKTAMSVPPRPPKLAILAMPESTASVVYGMYDLFRCAGRDWGLIVDGRPGRPVIAPVVVARTAGLLTAANEVPIRAEAALDDCLDPDVVCVPELMVPPGEPLDGRFGAEVDWLRRCHARGATLATACSGALLLAEAGLLDGCEATTHWAYCDVMQQRYPSVKVRTQRALVVAGEGQRLVMAGGGTSWLDVALYLIARFADVEAAMQVARLSLIDWHHVGQQPFARLACSRQVDDALIGRCQVWIAENYRDPAPVAAMTRLSGLPERSFKRRFQQATGMPPLQYVHTVRLEEAKHLLETTPLPLDAIANEVGYEDAGFFGRLFKREVNLTPAHYRKRFRSLRDALRVTQAA